MAALTRLIARSRAASRTASGSSVLEISRVISNKVFAASSREAATYMASAAINGILNQAAILLSLSESGASSALRSSDTAPLMLPDPSGTTYRQWVEEFVGVDVRERIRSTAFPSSIA